MQGPEVVATVGAELDHAINRTVVGDQRAAATEAAHSDEVTGLPHVIATDSGYLQAIDEEGLIAIAREHAFVTAFDGEPMRDGDPAVSVNLDERTITWFGAHDGETASLHVVGEVEVIEAWDEANVD